jgi:16S rRNA (adenine1518-N6/adenine1519-N6)-dimethyltransferase
MHHRRRVGRLTRTLRYPSNMRASQPPAQPFGLLHSISMTRQHLGQHFLADASWREQIAQAIGVLIPSTEKSPADYSWIEIGPGHGEMTEYLVGSGRRVHAIELDETLLSNLNRLKKKFSNLDIIHSDILQADLRAIAAGRRIRIYGSLPYYITSPILHHLFQLAECIEEIHVVVQTEVAERLAAEPGSKAYGYLSVATQLHARPELVLEIPRGAFQPPPEVGSTLVSMRLPGVWKTLSATGISGTAEGFLEFVKLCFSKKRKTLVNNLRDSRMPEEIREALEKAGLRGDARAEQIPIPKLAELWSALR